VKFILEELREINLFCGKKIDYFKTELESPFELIFGCFLLLIRGIP